MALPAPPATPAIARLPGSTRIVSEPMLAIAASTSRAAPSPISTMAITAPTPITMPSVVNAERKTCRRRALTAICGVR